MSDIELEAIGTPGELTLLITYPNLPNLTYNFKMNINISKQLIGGYLSHLLTKQIYFPQKNVKIQPIQGRFIYKIECQCNFNGMQSKKAVFAFVPIGSDTQPQDENIDNNEDQLQNQRNQRRQNRRLTRQIKPKAKFGYPLSNSQSLMKMVGNSVGITNQKKLQRYILEGRTCRNIKQFINSKKQMQSGNRIRLIQKQQMLLKGKLLLKQVYHQKKGMQFLKNDWFMGPFYSYDKNQQDLARQ